jgi:hypothetical protein
MEYAAESYAIKKVLDDYFNTHETPKESVNYVNLMEQMHVSYRYEHIVKEKIAELYENY